MIIYKAQNKINNKIYIGTTNEGLDNRIYEHWKKSKQFFGNALRKYGIQSFDISIVDSALLKEIAYEKEIYWIKFYNSKIPNGYNLTNGGEGAIGYCHSEDSKRKISKANKGKPLSEETKKKLSEASKGRIFSEEHKKNLSESQKGKSGFWKGKHLSEEAKQKMSKSHKGKTHSKETNQKISENKKLNQFGVKNPNWRGGISKK